MIEIADTQTKEELTDERFKKIMLKFLLNEPFFSDIMSHIRRQKTYAIPTANKVPTGPTHKAIIATNFESPIPIASFLKKHFARYLKDSKIKNADKEVLRPLSSK